MLMTVRYRSAEKLDCAKIAELTNVASDGVAEYLFHDLIPEMTPTQIIAYNLEQDVYPHTYKSATVAVDGTAVVGLALSYPSSYHMITPEMRAFFPGDRLAHLNDFFAARVPDSWYLDTLAVEKAYRKKGIGTKLLELNKEQASTNGLDVLSLIVFADNTPALNLYKRYGFRVAADIKVEPNKFIQRKSGCLLLRCDLADE
jgi:ribosomal protein S18 acetylase RimI-like enzyme